MTWQAMLGAATLIILLGGAVAHGIHQIGGIQDQPSSLIDQDPRFRDALERNALFRYAPAECDALLGALAHHFERPFGQTDQTHAMVDAPGSQAALRNFEAASLAQQEILHGYAHVDEVDLRVAMGRVIVAEHVELAQPHHAGRGYGHQDHRLLAVQRRARIGLAHENQDFAARITRAGGPPLAAVDHVVIAVAHDGRLDIRGIARRDVGLGHGEGRADSPVEQGLEPALLLLGGGVAGQHFHVARVGGRAIEGLGCEMRASHDLAQRRVLEVGETGAVLGVRQEEIPQILRPCLALQVLHHLGGPPGIAVVTVFLHFFVEAPLRRVDVSVHETLQLLLQETNFFAVREIHA